MNTSVMQHDRSRYIPVFIVLISVITILLIGVISVFIFNDDAHKTQNMGIVTHSLTKNVKLTDTAFTPDGPYPPDGVVIPDGPYPPDGVVIPDGPYPPDSIHSTL